MTRVLIVTPCFNQGAFLEDAIRSCIAQTLPEWQLVIVDDGSKWSESRAIHKAVRVHDDSRVFEYYSDHGNRGSAWARNLGVMLGDPGADWIVPLDADDMLAPSHLETMLAMVGRAGFAYCDYREFGEREGRLCAGDWRAVRERNTIHHGGALISRRMWDTLGGYNPRLRYSEDWDFWLRGVHAGFVGQHVEATLYRYRRHPGSKMKTGPTLAGRRQAIAATNPEVFRE